MNEWKRSTARAECGWGKKAEVWLEEKKLLHRSQKTKETGLRNLKKNIRGITYWTEKSKEWGTKMGRGHINLLNLCVHASKLYTIPHWTRISYSFASFSQWTSHRGWRQIWTNYSASPTHSRTLAVNHSNIVSSQGSGRWEGGLVTVLSSVRHYVDIWGRGCKGEALFPGNGLCKQAPSVLEECRKSVQSPWRQGQSFSVGGGV